LKDVWLTVAELKGKPSGGWRNKTCCKVIPPVYRTGGITPCRRPVAHRLGAIGLGHQILYLEFEKIIQFETVTITNN
jgi:hypothetical protein